MGYETAILHTAARQLSVYYKNSDEIVQSVMNHALAAAGSAALSGALPGAGSTIAIGVSTGIIVKMYISLGKMLGIHIGNGVLKAMASALDVAGSVAASLGASTILSFVPGIGTLGAAAITGITNFGYVYLAGIIYIKMITKILESGKSISNMSEEEILKELKKTTNTVNMKEAMKEAKTAYKNNKKE